MIATYLADDHRRLEDALSRSTGHGGTDLEAYDQCQQLAGSGASEILVRLQSAPEVKMAAYVDSPVAIRSAHQALRRAGYDLKF